MESQVESQWSNEFTQRERAREEVCGWYLYIRLFREQLSSNRDSLQIKHIRKIKLEKEKNKLFIAREVGQAIIPNDGEDA